MDSEVTFLLSRVLLEYSTLEQVLIGQEQKINFFTLEIVPFSSGKRKVLEKVLELFAKEIAEDEWIFPGTEQNQTSISREEEDGRIKVSCVFYGCGRKIELETEKKELETGKGKNGVLFVGSDPDPRTPNGGSLRTEV